MKTWKGIRGYIDSGNILEAKKEDNWAKDRTLGLIDKHIKSGSLSSTEIKSLRDFYNKVKTAKF